MNKGKIKVFIGLHLLLMVYSMSGILSKTAANHTFLSVPFCICYMGIIFLLGLYAVGWQQVIKRMPLTMAFANKAITIVWGMIWGAAFFQEKVTVGKILGIVLVMIGIILYVKAEPDNG